jgi:hypothetical protein
MLGGVACLLREHPSRNLIEVQIPPGGNPRWLLQCLRELVEVVVSTVMPSLQPVFAISHRAPPAPEVLVNLQALATHVEQRTALPLGSGRELAAADILALYRQWLPPGGPRDRYDVLLVSSQGPPRALARAVVLCVANQGEGLEPARRDFGELELLRQSALLVPVLQEAHVRDPSEELLVTLVAALELRASLAVQPLLNLDAFSRCPRASELVAAAPSTAIPAAVMARVRSFLTSHSVLPAVVTSEWTVGQLMRELLSPSSLTLEASELLQGRDASELPSLVAQELLRGVSEARRKRQEQDLAFQVRQAQQLDKLQQLLRGMGQTDHAAFDSAWAKFTAGGVEAGLLAAAKELQERFGNGVAKQQSHVNTVGALCSQAEAAFEGAMASMRAFVEGCGGTFLAGPLKSAARIQAKVDSDYHGDCSHVVDVVRGSGLFEQAAAMQKALREAIRYLDMVRAKDRLNHPLPAGYRDVLLNVRFGDHVCELQLHVKAIHDHKELAHRAYELQRAMEEPSSQGQAKGAALAEDPASPPACPVPQPAQQVCVFMCVRECVRECVHLCA